VQSGGPGKKPVTTNVVEIRVLPAPKLGWIPFNGEDPAQSLPRSYMKDETTTGLMVNFDIPGMFAYEIKRDGVIYQRLSIPGQATLLSAGKPDVPIMGQVVEVPYDVNLGIEVVKAKSITLNNYNVYPGQILVDQPAGPPVRPFALDKHTYLTDAYFPERPAVITAEDIGIIRGHRLVFFKVNPIQFNPMTRELKAYSNIEVRITYDRPAQIRRVARRIESPSFEKLLKALVLNYKAPNRFGQTDVHGIVALTEAGCSVIPSLAPPAHAQARVPGCDYLILTHGNFYTNPQDPNNPLNRLRDWKQRKGLTVRIVDVASLSGGATAAAIRAYLQNAYDTWYPVPAYVLLIGDYDLVPTDLGGVVHPDHGAATATDLPYAQVDGADYFPDLFMGRLSVDTMPQLTAVVDKILSYEQNPPANPNYYRDTSLVAEFEDSGSSPNDGREERPWIENVEDVRTFLQNNQYVVDRIYATNSGFPPQSPATPSPLQYSNGHALPNALLVPNYGWTGGPADISNAINAGRFLVTYRNHAGQTDWTRPSFTTGNIAALANIGLPSVVFSIACQSGWFDDPVTECFCEEFLRLGNQRGAVAILGATRNSYSGWNDYLMFGLYKAIWPAYAPNPDWSTADIWVPHPGIPVRETSPLYQMGQIHTFGKAFMANGYVASTERRLTFEMYHLFGDPEMPVWTREPAAFQVDCPEGIGSTGTQDFIVKATDNATGLPVENAVVTLMSSGTLVSSQFTNPDGVARFTGTYAPGDLNLTITAHNYRPYQGVIKVSSAGADLSPLEPTDGPVNQAIHVKGQNFAGNENVDIYLGNQLVKTQAATGGSFGQANDVDITIPAAYPLGLVNVWVKGQTSPGNRYAVDVFQVRQANLVDLYLYSQWDENTWTLHPGDNPTWDNPDIQLYDGANKVDSNNLVVGHEYLIKVTVHNAKNFEAKKVKVNLRWVQFGAGQPNSAWTPITPAPEVDVPANGTKEAEAHWTPAVTGHVCLQAELYHVEDINSANNKGQENCHVGPTSSPARVPFKIWNPTDKAAAMFLEVRQMSPAQPIWKTTVEHPDPQIVPPGGSTEGTVIIEPVQPSDCRQPADFALTGFIAGQVVGGVNFRISCGPEGLVGVGAAPWKCCLLWGVFLAALIAAIVFLAAALAGVWWAWQALAAAGFVLAVAGLFLLSSCVPAWWRCCAFWLLFGFGLVSALTLLICAVYAKKMMLWSAFAIVFAATAFLGWLLIAYCDAYYLVVGGFLLALLLLALMGFRQFRASAKIAQVD
jgi:hypothetical protein